jgi:hypothetical protein
MAGAYQRLGPRQVYPWRISNKSFATLEGLDAALGERCRTLAAMPEIIKARTSYEWWPTADPAASPAN